MQLKGCEGSPAGGLPCENLRLPCTDSTHGGGKTRQPRSHACTAFRSGGQDFLHQNQCNIICVQSCERALPSSFLKYARYITRNEAGERLILLFPDFTLDLVCVNNERARHSNQALAPT